MKRPHASDDVRERALAAIDAGHPVVDVAAFFQNDPSTIRRWMRQRTRTGCGLARARAGRPRLVRSAQEPALTAQVSAQPDATLAWHCQHWQETHAQSLSVATMSRRLRGMGITLKKRP